MVEKGRKKLKRADKLKWPGVYAYEMEILLPGGKPDVSFYISYRDGRRKIWEKIGRKSEGITPQIADDIRKERTLKARHGEQILTAKAIKRKRAKANRPLNDIAEAYFKQRGGSAQAAKFDQYRYDKHIKPILGDRSVSSLSEVDIKRIEKSMKGAAVATIWGALEMVRRLTNFGKRAGLCGGLAFKIKMPKRDNQVVEFLTPDQAARLLNILGTWPAQDVANMLKVAMFSGLRRGEIFKLEDRDVDTTNKLIQLRSPKGGRTVSIPLNPVIEKILETQKAWRDEIDPKTGLRRRPVSLFLFPGRGGKMRVDCSAVDRIRIKAQLPSDFRMFHGLRHHFAVTLANSGEFTLDMIGELLTHKNSEMTRRYAQFLPGSLQRAGNRAAELLQTHAANGETRTDSQTTEA